MTYDHNWRVIEAGRGPIETARSPWSVWGIRLAAVLSVLIAISLGWDWIEAFYRGVAVNAQISYKAFDQELAIGTPLHASARAIIGNHYFSDFQLPMGYATSLRHSISPYFGPNPPEQYPPFSQILFIPFSFLPVRTSAVIYLALSAALFLVPLWLLLAPLKTEYRIFFLTPVAVLSTPLISLLDRGNDIGIAVGFVAWAIWAWRSERWVLCGSFLAAAIALKAYPAGILVVPLALRRYRFTIFVVAGAAVANLISLVMYPGGYFRNLREVLPALQGKGVPLTQLTSWSLYSVIPKTVGLASGLSSTYNLLEPKGLVVWIPSILYLVGVYVVIRRGRVPQWCWGPLSLASIQLIVPFSFAYTTAWAPLAAVWFAWGYLVDVRGMVPPESKAEGWIALRIMLLFALALTIAPSVFTIGGAHHFHTPVGQYLSPILLVITLCTALFYSLGPVSHESPPGELIESESIIAKL
jgi:hypothetical protein